jgi:hypothetical protein
MAKMLQAPLQIGWQESMFTILGNWTILCQAQGKLWRNKYFHDKTYCGCASFWRWITDKDVKLMLSECTEPAICHEFSFC